MEVENILNRYEVLNYLLANELADSTEFLAKKLNLSPRQVRNILDKMRQRGIPVRYNRKINRYVYEDGGYLDIKFEYISGKNG